MQPGDSVGGFVLDLKLGQGGMGEVWKARDAALGRHVALKLIREAGDLERLRREATTAAGLAHPGIVQIFAVGPGWISMELVDGITIDRARLDARAAAIAIRDAATAVAFAHAAGIIHRDLKPANIMIDREGKVRVMDFGLARPVQEGNSLTRTGMIVGTPAYMSPEQARGERADRRSDIYGLGATLYELLAKRAPFDGSNVLDVALKVVNDDPEPIAGAPGDLVAVLMKCLEKEPARRYAAAVDVADDLDRFIRGEPVTARPPGLRRRLKRRLGWIAAVVVGLSLAAVGAWALRRGDLVGQTRETAQTVLDAALDLRRAGNLAAMRQLAPQVEEDCRRTSRSFPQAPEPHFLLGRMYRALMRTDDALREQEAALAKDPGYAPARYERALLLARRLRARRKELVEEAWKLDVERRRMRGGGRVEPGQWTAPAIGLDAEVSRLMERIEADLAAVDNGSLAPAESAFARGLRAWVQSRDGDAKAACQESVRILPPLEDAIEALAALEGDNLQAAAAWLTLGIQHDRGYVPYRLARCVVHLLSSTNAPVLGLPQQPFFEAALADIDAAVTLDPDSAQLLQMRSDVRCRLASATGGDDGLFLLAENDASRAIDLEPANPEALIRRAMVRTDRGMSLAEHVKDPTGCYRGALQDLDAALEKDRSSESAWRRKGMVYVNLANRAANAGGDAEPLYQQARDALGEALTLNPSKTENWLHRAAATANLAASRRQRGGDPTLLLREAIADYAEAIRLAPAWSEPWLRRASAWTSLALHEGRMGADTTASYEEAERDFARAIALDPGWWHALMLRGRMRSNRAARIESGRGDPVAHFKAAQADLEEAARRHPSDDALLGLGDLFANWGVHDSHSGRDPTVRYRAAIEALDRALALNPTQDETWQSRGSAKYNLGAWEAWAKRDPTAWFESALRDVGEALARNDARVDTVALRAKIRSNFGAHLEKSGADPRTMYAGAIADLDRVVTMQPSRASAFASRGVAKARLASWIEDRGGDPDALAAGAIDDFGRAVTMEPGNVEARMNRGRTSLNCGTRRVRLGSDATAHFRAAIEDFDALLKAVPSNTEAWLHRGTASLLLARTAKASGRDARPEYRRALESWNEALKRDPKLEDYLDRGMKECREQLGE